MCKFSKGHITRIKDIFEVAHMANANLIKIIVLILNPKYFITLQVTEVICF